jgi:CHAP domain
MSGYWLSKLACGAVGGLLAVVAFGVAGPAMASMARQATGSTGTATGHALPRSKGASASALPPPGYGAGAGYCTGYPGGVTSGYSFDNVYACEGTTTGSTTFDQPGDIYAWQCVELSARFLWAVDGIWAGPGSGVQDGADLVSVVHASHPQIPVGNPGPGSVPVPGDVISLGPGGGTDPTFGHTAVVISADEGTGQFEIMSENSPEGSAGEQSLQVDLTGAHNGEVLLHGAWTVASWLEVGTAPLGNGSFVQVSGSPAIYEIAGGAPLYVSSWSAFGGQQPFTVISAAAFDALSPVPANGTMIRSAQTGGIYIVAGGAPLYVSGCADFNGCAGDVNVDQWDITNAGSAASHLSLRPANGTMIRSAQTEGIYIVAGGAPLYVSSCADFNGCAGDVNVDQWDITNAGSAASHLNSLPANGTFIRGGTRGTYYRVAGGYPFKITDCKIIGGCKHPVVVDPWDLTHLTNPQTHLRSNPRNGTIVRCSPSRKYWSFKNGKRHRSTASKRAVSVDDSSVTHFPI